ncbi:hypothetical protein TrRE_jg9510, partial [Triparma retinervis]
MSGNWAIAIADYDNDASNTLKLQTGDKIFDCRVDVNTPEWSVGTDESGNVGYFPTSHVQQTASRPVSQSLVSSSSPSSSPSSPHYSRNSYAPGTASSSPPLPPDWGRKASNGRVYYVNLVTNDTQWEFPTSPAKRRASRRSVSKLPGGWERKTSTKSGRVYYYSTVTGETSWEHPGAGSPRDAQDRSPSLDYVLDANAELEAAYRLATSRVMMKKKLGPESKYQDRYVFVSQDLSEFCWAKPKSKLGVFKGVPFDDVMEVRQSLPVKRAKKHNPAFDGSCLSVYHKGGVIDLVIDDNTEKMDFGGG